MAPSSAWQATKSSPKSPLNWALQALDKLSSASPQQPSGDGPSKSSSNSSGSLQLGSIAHESAKAARILYSFRDEGSPHASTITAVSNGDAAPTTPAKAIAHSIPAPVLQRAIGLCIFRAGRVEAGSDASGDGTSGIGGSGVLLARLPGGGGWSEPAAVLLRMPQGELASRVEAYGSVLVINSPAALDAFAGAGLGLELGAEGSEIGVTIAEPMGNDVRDGGLNEKEAVGVEHVVAYVKSKGVLRTDVKLEGMVVVERADENERFYGAKVSARDIFANSNPSQQQCDELKMLRETIRAVEGATDIDATLLPSGNDDDDDEPTEPPSNPSNDQQQSQAPPPPAVQGFGVPAPQDPDPFGVHMLEQSGLEIHEAGTGVKPSGQEFEFHPSPTSPVYGAEAKQAAAHDGGVAAAAKQRASGLSQVDTHDESRRSADETAATVATARASANTVDIDDKEAGGDVADGVGALRVAAEDRARLEQGRDELHTPGADAEEELLRVGDPIAAAGNEILEQEAAESERAVEAAQKEAQEVQEKEKEKQEGKEQAGEGKKEEEEENSPMARLTTVPSSKGDEIAEEKKSSVMDKIKQAEERLKQGPPPVLPLR